MAARVPLIAVVGGSKATAAEAEVAEAVGRALAEHGVVLICGGRGGVMAAVCRGSHQRGGLTIGILPGSDPDQANDDVDIAIPTGIGLARNAIIVRAAQAVIAIGGSYGTLSEVAHALQFGVPVVGLGTWHATREGHPPLPIHYAATPQEAVELALTLAGHPQA